VNNSVDAILVNAPKPEMAYLPETCSIHGRLYQTAQCEFYHCKCRLNFHQRRFVIFLPKVERKNTGLAKSQTGVLFQAS
jgi:hypothetical protein